MIQLLTEIETPDTYIVDIDLCDTLAEYLEKVLPKHISQYKKVSLTISIFEKKGKRSLLYSANESTMERMTTWQLEAEIERAYRYFKERKNG